MFRLAGVFFVLLSIIYLSPLVRNRLH